MGLKGRQREENKRAQWTGKGVGKIEEECEGNLNVVRRKERMQGKRQVKKKREEESQTIKKRRWKKNKRERRK